MIMGQRIPENVRGIIFQGMGLCSILFGISMALPGREPLLLISSMLLGGIVGELLHLETRFVEAGDALKARLRLKNPVFTEGLITASLLFCVGSLAILGPIEEVLQGSRTILYTKSTLDFCAAMALGARYGSSVICSGVLVWCYQGIFTLFAGLLQDVLTEPLQRELNAVGGLLVMGIGINMLGLTTLRLGSLLPALLFAGVFGVLFL